MKSVFSASAWCIRISLYPLNASIKLNSLWQAAASTTMCMWGKGNESFGHALFKSVKSMQTLYFPFFFLTTMTLASQSGFCAYLTDQILDRLEFWVHIQPMGDHTWFIPVMYSWIQVKQLHLVYKNYISRDLIDGSSLNLINTFLLLSHGWMGTLSSVCSTSSAGGSRCSFYVAAEWGFSLLA